MQDGASDKDRGIAANMARVGSISAWPETQNVAFDLLEESKFFIEWIAMKADIDTTGALIELQLQLVLWRRQLDKCGETKIRVPKSTDELKNILTTFSKDQDC